MRKTVFITVTFVILMCFTGCLNVRSESYSAVGYVHGNTSKNAYMDFKKFKGNQVFKLDVEEGDRVHYYADLEEGSAKVFTRTSDGSKEEWFTVKAGEEVDSSEDFPEGDLVIEVETDGSCKGGKLKFEIEEML